MGPTPGPAVGVDLISGAEPLRVVELAVGMPVVVEPQQRAHGLELETLREQQPDTAWYPGLEVDVFSPG